MTTQLRKKSNRKIKNVKRAALIKFKLYSKGLKPSDVASELHISRSAIYRSFNGLSKITRVDEWLEKNLGMEAVNA